MKIGMIGLGQRGNALLSVILTYFKEIEVSAVCDNYPDRTEKAIKEIEDKTGSRACACSTYEELLQKNLDAVIISASWEEHVPLAVACMEAGIAVGLEVGGAYCVEDCWRLVDAYERTKTPFMFLENCCYDKTELMATFMARKGIFGEIVHCSGAYSHDLREEICGGWKNRHYRLRNYLQRNCENYPTHELGPIAKILDINRGNRMVSLVSVASKSRGLQEYVSDEKRKADPRLRKAVFKQGDIVDTLITCANGETIHLMLNTTLPCVYDRALVVRGTKGMYNQSCNFVVLDGETTEGLWTGIENNLKRIDSAKAYEQKYLPAYWKNLSEEDKQTGHGGMDGYMLQEFFAHVKSGKEMPIDVYDAASWMCVSCLSEQSIMLGGQPVAIPDFTRGKWIQRSRLDVVKAE